MNNFWQAAVIKLLVDARICWSEWYGRRVNQQRVLFDGVCEVQGKAVSVINKLIEVRITSG